MADSNLHDTWSEINSIFQQKYPVIYDNLNDPVKSETLTAMEEQIEVIFPKSIIILYTIHNGESDNSEGVFGGWKWLPLENVRTQYLSLKDMETEYPTDYDENNSIPIFEYQGEILYVESGGSLDSPIYLRDHGNPVKLEVAQSVNSFFTDYLSKMIAGEFIFRQSEKGWFDMRPKDSELWPWH